MATVVCGLGASPTASAAIYPTQDPFYAAPDNITTFANGDVIRSRSTKIQTLPGLNLPYKAYQVLYRSTDRMQKPIANVATIIMPLNQPATDRKLISYQTAYDGLSPKCRPSYSLPTGRVGLQGAETLLMGSILKRGWTIVTSDYEGPDDAFLVRETTAHGVLDGIRAAERFEPAGFTAQGTSTKVGMMGYSGGGQATAYAGEVASLYSPELNIVGAAQGGVAVSQEHAFRTLDGQLFAGIAFAAIRGISRGYPELDFDSYLNKKGVKVFRDISTKWSCISEYAFFFAGKKVRDSLTVPDMSFVPNFLKIADENSLGKVAPKFPTYWYQTVLDQMDGYRGAKRVAKGYCKASTPLQFITTWTEEHAIQSFSMPFKAQMWMADRMNGVPVNSNCKTL